MPLLTRTAVTVLALTATLAGAQSAPAVHEHDAHHDHGAVAAAPNTSAVRPLDRTTVLATDAEYEHVIGDMQKLLKSLGEINGALAQRDWALIARVAGELRPEKTMGSPEPAAVSFHAKIPAGWSGLGAPMHQGFTRIAQEAQGERRVDVVLKLMAETTRQCASCHARFQIRRAEAR